MFKGVISEGVVGGRCPVERRSIRLCLRASGSPANGFGCSQVIQAEVQPDDFCIGQEVGGYAVAAFATSGIQQPITGAYVQSVKVNGFSSRAIT